MADKTKHSLVVSLADLNGDIVPVREALLHVEGNVNGDLDEEGNCQPADHSIPPEQKEAVGQEHPHRHIGGGHVSCTHTNCHKDSLQPQHVILMLR